MGVIILPTQTMHDYFREIHQNHHTFALFDPTKMGNKGTSPFLFIGDTSSNGCFCHCHVSFISGV